MDKNTAVSAEQQIADQFFLYSDAGNAVIQIKTREVYRTAHVLRKAILGGDRLRLYEWDDVDGFRVYKDDGSASPIHVKGTGSEFVESLMKPLVDLRDPNSDVNSKNNQFDAFYYVFINPHPYMDLPLVKAYLQFYADGAPSTDVCIVLITPDVTLDLPLGTVSVLNASTPTEVELEGILRSSVESAYPENTKEILGKFTDDHYSHIARVGQGMSVVEFQSHVSLAIASSLYEAQDQNVQLDPERVLESVSEGKTEVVRQTDILELYPVEDIGHVGGMQRLKDWIEERKVSFTDEFMEFGGDYPKGIMLAGVPGTGKSLAAKAIASALGVPMIRMDLGKVFSKFIGESESRIRQALNMIDSMGRCVVFLDEVDKGLGGIGGGGDGGTASRVLGTILTWMNDNTSGAFVVMTANRVQNLPPELSRNGRLDKVFSTLLPSADEREKVLEIHLGKRGKSFDDVRDADEEGWKNLVNSVMDNFVPAEIEQVVKDAIILAFNDDEADEVEVRHLLSAAEEVLPMYDTRKAEIDAIVEWASTHATPVSYAPEELGTNKSAVNGSATRTVRRRGRGRV